MIVWVDGATGVGKSSTAKRLAELLADRNAEYVESDQYWTKLLQDDNQGAICGCYPYYDKYFLGVFRKELEKKMRDFGRMPVVSMSLVAEPCKSELLDHFEKKKVSMLHIILEAKEETIKSRIENDPSRHEVAEDQKRKVPGQIEYLKNNYPDAVRINTEDKVLDETAGEIMDLL